MNRILTLLIIGWMSLHGQSGSWIPAGEMPFPVAGAASYNDRENIYLLGGYSSSEQTNVDYIQKYSTPLSIWKVSGHMNNSRFGFTAGFENDTVFYFGGLDDTVLNSKSLEVWTLADSAKTKDTGKVFDRIFAGSILDNNKLYIIGGNSASILGSIKTPYIVEYNTNEERIVYQNDTLYQEGVLPEQQMVVKKGDYIYIFGGVINSISNRIFRYHIITHSFERLAVNLFEPRAGGRAVLNSVTGDIYIIGGYNENSLALKTVEVFTDYGSWFSVQPGPELITGRSFPVAEFIGETIYVLGGFNEENEAEPSIEKLHAVPTSVSEEEVIPGGLYLYQNYPNPFNPETIISYSLKDASFISVDIYDMLGRKIKTLFSGYSPSGLNHIRWKGDTDEGFKAASGTYLLRISNGKFSDTKKMVMLR